MILVFKKGNIPHNLGKKHSKETRKKISKHHREYYADATKNPMYGKQHSEKTKRKIGKRRTGTTHTKKTKKKGARKNDARKKTQGKKTQKKYLSLIQYNSFNDGAYVSTCC